jgi:hypothetical protein
MVRECGEKGEECGYVILEAEQSRTEVTASYLRTSARDSER